MKMQVVKAQEWRQSEPLTLVFTVRPFSNPPLPPMNGGFSPRSNHLTIPTAHSHPCAVSGGLGWDEEVVYFNKLFMFVTSFEKCTWKISI